MTPTAARPASPATHQHGRSTRPQWWRWLRLGFTVAAVVVALLAIWNLFGFEQLFAFQAAKSQDDLKTIRDGMIDEAVVQFLLPIDPVLLMLTLISAVLFFVGRALWHTVRPPLVKTGFIVTLVCFVLSFLRVSAIIPALAAGVGFIGGSAGVEDDLRIAAEGEAFVSDVQLVRYTDGAVRAQGVITNTTDQVWETSRVDVVLLGKGDEICATMEHELQWLQPRQPQQIVTQVIEHRELASGCAPIAIAMTVPAYDVDSRTLETEIPATDIAIAFANLTVVETVRFAGTQMRQISVSGQLAPESLEQLRTGPESFHSPELHLEVARADGLRLDWQIAIGDIDPDGRFTTKAFHESVETGEFVSVVVVPAD